MPTVRGTHAGEHGFKKFSVKRGLESTTRKSLMSNVTNKCTDEAPRRLRVAGTVYGVAFVVRRRQLR
jgi:hypothetical protein